MTPKPGFRSALNNTVGEAQRRLARTRGNSLSTIPPKETDEEHVPALAACAASILYRTPKPSPEGRPMYVLNAAAFPDAFDVDYDSLISYVLDRLPKEDELLSGMEYEIIFFAGGQPEGATTEKKNGPGIGWYIRAYEVLSRALRKKLQRLYIVHPRTWVRVLLGAFSTIVSPKFRRKLVHVNNLSALAEYVPVEQLLIPPSVYVQDRRVKSEIYVPYATGRRAFGARHPFPRNLDTGETRLPRVLRETTAFLLMGENVKTEGLFRIPPNAVLSGVLQEAYDRGQRWIVWKERMATLVEPGVDQKLVDHVRLEDAYSVHLAAALIKVWYRELREPIFPETTYDALRELAGSGDQNIAVDNLNELLQASSDRTPLSMTSREILTRHLLPLLSEVATHESSNKMTSENLAIVFSMCTVCGSNQIEDAKFANTTVKQLLITATDSWPLLRDKLGLTRDDFWTGLKPPRDARNYEDPFDESRPSKPSESLRASEDDAIEGRHGHRINLDDFETGVIKKSPTLPPALPPRPRHAISADFLNNDGQPLPPIPQAIVARRKPAPHHAEAPPPRYSTEFGPPSSSNMPAESPRTYPAEDLESSHSGSSNEDLKTGLQASDAYAKGGPNVVVKRKAVSGEHSIATPTTSNPNVAPASANVESTMTALDTKALATSAAQKAASKLGSQLDAAFTPPGAPTADIVHSPDAVSASSAPGEHVFRKPSWPASARPEGSAKPALPPRQSRTVPLINQPTPSSLADRGAREGVPKVRAPSPGLLKRISSMDGANNAPSPIVSPVDGSGEQCLSPTPRKLNLKKQSVEDLRRLYEERNSVAESLERAEASRRKSSSSSVNMR